MPKMKIRQIIRDEGPKSHFRRRKAARVKRLFGSKVGLDSNTISKTIKQAISAIK